MSSLLCSIITFYQRAISPYMAARCRYVPSCSEYMKEAVHAHGLWHGGLSGLRRFVRCAPWGGCGLDIYEKKS